MGKILKVYSDNGQNTAQGRPLKTNKYFEKLIVAIEKNSYFEIEEKACADEKIPYQMLLNTLEWEEKRKTIIERDNKKCTSCDSLVNLQVHLEYLIRQLPWEYNASALKTLCGECHNSLHSDWRTFIPVYIMKEGKKVLFNGAPCIRCGGSGNLPQHRKIQNGICFRCRGCKFDQILFHRIIKKTANI